MKEQLADAAIGVSGKDALMAMGLTYLAFARKHPGLYEATLWAPDRNDLRRRSYSYCSGVAEYFSRICFLGN
jgi:hypothetical protein